MQVITLREFNANQKKYFELAENEVVYVVWKDARLIAIRATSNEDELSEAEWQSIQRGLDDIKKRQNVQHARRGKLNGISRTDGGMCQIEFSEEARKDAAHIAYYKRI